MVGGVVGKTMSPSFIFNIAKPSAYVNMHGKVSVYEYCAEFQ
jgi:hypothetical protein